MKEKSFQTKVERHIWLEIFLFIFDDIEFICEKKLILSLVLALYLDFGCVVCYAVVVPAICALGVYPINIFIFFLLFLNRLHTCPPNYRLLLPFAGNDVDVVVTQQLSRTETSLYLWQLHMGAIGVPLSVSFDASLVPFCFVFSNLLAASPLQQKLAFNSIF